MIIFNYKQLIDNLMKNSSAVFCKEKETICKFSFKIRVT